MKKLFFLFALCALLLSGSCASAKKVKEAPFHNAKEWTTYKIIAPRDTYFVGIKDKATHGWASFPYDKHREAGKVLILTQDLFANHAYAGYIWIYGRQYFGSGRNDYYTGRGWYKLEGGKLRAIVPIGQFDEASYYDEPISEVPLFQCARMENGANKFYLFDGEGRAIISGASSIESKAYPDGHCWRFAWDAGMQHAKAVNHLGQVVFSDYLSVEYFGQTEHLRVLAPNGKWGLLKRDGTSIAPCEYEAFELPAVWAKYKQEHNLL